SWALKTIQIDGTHEKAFLEGKGSPLWKQVVGRAMALGADNGKVAFLGQCDGIQMRRPDALLREGPITLLDLETGSRREVGVRGLDTFLAWLPDGRSLVASSLLPKTSGGDLPLLTDDAAALFKDWAELPAVRILDVETGGSRFVSWGYHGAVSTDGDWLCVLAVPLVR